MTYCTMFPQNVWIQLPIDIEIIKHQHKNVERVCEKISRKKLDFPVLSVVFLCIQKAATYDITC